MRFAKSSSTSAVGYLFLYASAAASVISWFIYWISLAVVQNNNNDPDLGVFSTSSSRAFSFYWWAFAFQLFLIVVVVIYPSLSTVFSNSLFSILTLYSIVLFTEILNDEVFTSGSGKRGVVAGAFLLILIDFYWLFYFSTLPSSASAFYIFPPKPTASKTEDLEYKQEQHVEPAPVTTTAPETVGPAPPVTEVPVAPTAAAV